MNSEEEKAVEDKVPGDTSAEHHYMLAFLETVENGKKRERFFRHKGISYGRGKFWVVSPEERQRMCINLPVPELTQAERARARVGGGPLTKAQKEKDTARFLAWQDPEFLALLQEKLLENPPCDLPEDATVARCQIELDAKAFFAREEEGPYSERNIEVLVLSKTFDRITEGRRHPLLQKEG